MLWTNRWSEADLGRRAPLALLTSRDMMTKCLCLGRAARGCACVGLISTFLRDQHSHVHRRAVRNQPREQHIERGRLPKPASSPPHIPSIHSTYTGTCASAPHRRPLHVHHGHPQHLKQWPKHYAELPKRHQQPSCFRAASQLTNVRPMGSLHRSCPARQRIPARWRQGERVESTKHRRYVRLARASSVQHWSSSELL